MNQLRDVATHPDHFGLVFRAPSTCHGVLAWVCRPVRARSQLVEVGLEIVPKGRVLQYEGAGNEGRCSRIVR